jgi:hypothetical protein
VTIKIFESQIRINIIRYLTSNYGGSSYEKVDFFSVLCLYFIFAVVTINDAAAQVKSTSTNKDKLLTLAVQCAVTIGVCNHGWSDYAGHGRGLNPVLAALPGKIKRKIKKHANVAYYLGIKEKPNYTD